MRVLLMLLLAAGLAGSLAACGKKGDLEPPASKQEAPKESQSG